MKNNSFNVWFINNKVLLVLIFVWAIVAKAILIPLILCFLIVGPKFIKRRLDFSIRWTEWVHFLFILSFVLMGGLFYLNKQETNFFNDLSSWVPLAGALYILEYSWSSNKDYVWKRKIKKKYLKTPEYINKRVKNFNKFYLSNFNIGAVIYPKAVFLVTLILGIISSLNPYINKDFKGVIESVLICLVLIIPLLNLKNIIKQRNKKECLIYLIILIVVFSISLFSYNIISNSLQNYQRKHSWSFGGATWFNPEFDHSSIGETGNFTSNTDLLFRIIWNERPDTLLPAAYYDMTMDGVNWQDYLGGNEVLKDQQGSRTVPDPDKIKIVYNSIKNEDYWDTKLIKIPTTLSLKENISNINVKDNKSAIIIGTPLKYRNGRTYLPIPSNTHVLLGGDSADISISSGGNVIYSGYSGEVNLQYLYNDNKNIPLHAPNKMNLMVPKSLEPVLKKVIKEIGLKSTDPVEVNVNKLKKWYQDNFKYTLNLTENGKPRTLENFLLVSKRGHCEYFATTSALILRELGIPTRYVVGFSVSEAHPSEDKGMFWVRGRDKHAWTLYWDGSHWKNVNMTVAGEDNENVDFFTDLTDTISTIQYKISKIDISTYMNDSEYVDAFFMIVVFFIVIVLFLTRKKWKKIRKSGENINIHYKEIEFEKKMKEYLEKYPRENNEPWGIWVRKLQDKNLEKEILTFYMERYKKD